MSEAIFHQTWHPSRLRARVRLHTQEIPDGVALTLSHTPTTDAITPCATTQVMVPLSDAELVDLASVLVRIAHAHGYGQQRDDEQEEEEGGES